METSFLQTFVLVAQTGSMAEAGRRLGLTPAAVAQQLRALERELDAQLVARSGRTVLPTPAGYRLLGQAGQLLHEIGDLRLLVRDDVVAGELRLGTINTALHTMLPKCLGRLVREHPAVTLFIKSGNSQQLFEELRTGRVDAAICLAPQFALPKSMAWALLREESLIVLAPTHLAKMGALELLRTQPLLRYDRSLGGGKHADAYLRQHGIVPTERVELSSLLAIAMMVAEGLGVSLVPNVVTPLTQGLKVARVALPDHAEPHCYGLLWRRGIARERVVQAFLVIAQMRYSD